MCCSKYFLNSLSWDKHVKFFHGAYLIFNSRILWFRDAKTTSFHRLRRQLHQSTQDLRNSTVHRAKITKLKSLKAKKPSCHDVIISEDCMLNNGEKTLCFAGSRVLDDVPVLDTLWAHHGSLVNLRQTCPSNFWCRTTFNIEETKTTKKIQSDAINSEICKLDIIDRFLAW